MSPERSVKDLFGLYKALYGGGGGIRTPETLSSLTVFKTAAFNRSPTPPQENKGLIHSRCPKDGTQRAEIQPRCFSFKASDSRFIAACFELSRVLM